MCDCDCALPKHDRWALIRREHARGLTAKIRLFASSAGHTRVASRDVKEILEWAALEIDPDREGSNAPQEETQGG